MLTMSDKVEGKKWETHCLQEKTAIEVADYLKHDDIILVPCGSTERHGRHLPLGCDSFQAWEIAKRAAEQAGVLYTLPVWAGNSPHHMRRAMEGTGTITFRGDTYRSIYYDIGRSLFYHGFNRIIFVSLHGSNIKTTDEIMRRLRYETGGFIAQYQHALERQFGLIKDIISRGRDDVDVIRSSTWHASECETSMMLAMDPDYCHWDEMRVGYAHAPAWLNDKFDKIDGLGSVSFEGAENIWIPMDHYEYSDDAVIGDPRGSNAELGDALLQRMADHLAHFCDAVREIKLEPKEDKRDWPERAY